MLRAKLLIFNNCDGVTAKMGGRYGYGSKPDLRPSKLPPSKLYLQSQLNVLLWSCVALTRLFFEIRAR